MAINLDQESTPEAQAEGILSKADIAIAILLSLAALGAFLILVHREGGDYARLAVSSPCNRFFQSDAPLILGDMTDPAGNHTRGLFHPLFCGITLPIASPLIRLGAAPLQAIWAIDGVAMAVAIALLYVAQRALGVPRVGSVLACLLAPASAGFLFWGPMPETFPLGFLAITACLTISAIATRARIPTAVHVAAGVIAVGTTLSNVMAWLAALAVVEPRRRAVVLAAIAAVVTTVLWGAQRASLETPPAIPLRPKHYKPYIRYFFHPDTGGPAPILRGELIAPVVAPKPVVHDSEFLTPRLAIASFQRSPWLEGTLGVAATVAWVAALGLGLAGLASGPIDPRFRVVLAMVLAGQVVLHQLYGEETFLYALHFLPVLLLVVAMGVARWGRPAEALLALTIVLALANNIGRLRQTIELPLPPPPDKATALDSSGRQVNSKVLGASSCHAGPPLAGPGRLSAGGGTTVGFERSAPRTADDRGRNGYEDRRGSLSEARVGRHRAASHVAPAIKT